MSDKPANSLGGLTLNVWTLVAVAFVLSIVLLGVAVCLSGNIDFMPVPGPQPRIVHDAGRTFWGEVAIGSFVAGLGSLFLSGVFCCVGVVHWFTRHKP